jgi:cytoskeleton protein RodZ
MASHSEAAAPTLANPGETLRIAREQKNWTLAAVAQQLNLSERALAQIEAGDFSQLPGHTFARGYVRAYAKLLGLDQNRLVQQFDLHTGTDSSGANVNSLGHIDEPVRLSHNIIRFFTFALLLIVAGAAAYWWQDQRSRDASTPPVTALERIEVEAADGTTEIHLLDRAEDALEAEADDLAEAPAPAEPADDSTRQPLPLGDSQAPASPDEQAAPSTSPAAPAAPVAPPQAAVAASETAAVAPPVPAATEQQSTDAPALAAGEGRLELRYTADCWTQVTDADGRVLFSGLAKAGSSRTLTGKAPIDLRLGFASGVQISYNGEAVSLAGKTRGETARLKLGQ